MILASKRLFSTSALRVSFGQGTRFSKRCDVMCVFVFSFSLIIATSCLLACCLEGHQSINECLVFPAESSFFRLNVTMGISSCASITLFRHSLSSESRSSVDVDESEFDCSPMGLPSELLHSQPKILMKWLVVG